MFFQVHATRQAFVSDSDRPSGVRDMKRQCRGLGMAGKLYSDLPIHSKAFSAVFN